MRKGFTLIELLAVIVILAIIALIATPIILNIISDSKEEARERSIDNIIHAAQLYAIKSELNGNHVVHIEDIENMIDGEKPETGTIYFNENGEVAFSLDFKGQIYAKSFKGKINKENQVYSLKELEEPKKGSNTEETINLNKAEKFLDGPISKDQIEKIITVPTNEVPTDEFILGSWDVSNVKESNKVRAWYKKNEETQMYIVYIGQEGGVKTNVNSSYLFSYLTEVKEIDLTYLDTTGVQNMNGMFQNCLNLIKVDVSDFKLDLVTNIEYMFHGCSSLTELDVSNWNISNVMYMRDLFYNCKKLTYLDVSKWDTSNVRSFVSAFGFCESLKELDVSNWNVSKIQNPISVFRGCKSLTKLDVSKWKTTKFKDVTSMFLECENLVELDVSNWDMRNVTTMLDLFAYCSSLKEIDVSKWQTPKLQSMEGIFINCDNLTTLDLSSWDVTNVTTMKTLFAGADNLETVYVNKATWVKPENIEKMFNSCPAKMIDKATNEQIVW